MKNQDLLQDLIDLSNKFNDTIVNIEKTMAVNNEILRAINDQNKMHKQAIETNTIATREMTKSFNKIWYIFWIAILALVVLAGAEKVLKFI
jgi:hypothetical protein